MTSPKRTGRTIGLILLIQAATTAVIYSKLLPPVTSSTFLTSAAPHATSIRVALLLSLAVSSMTLVVALIALPIFRGGSERLAIAYVALSVFGMATTAAETLGFRNLLAFSLEYAKPTAPHELLQSIGAAAHSTALLTHFTNLISGHAVMATLYLTLFRLSLVPRLLTIAGMIASIIGVVDVAQPLIGGRFSFLYVYPAGVCLLALVLWLLLKGFNERRP